MLINTPNPVNPGDLIDQPATEGGPPTGTLNGSEYNGWTVYDSVGTTLTTTSNPGDVSYGFVNFVTTLGQATNYATPNSTAIPVSFGVDYFGRANNDVGSIATDWIASGNLSGQVPTWGLGGQNHTQPSSDANRPLNTLGAPNFDSSLPATVTTSGSTLTYPVGSGNVVVDPNVTVADPDSYFLGSATVTINSPDYNPATDTLVFNNTPNITGTFSTVTIGAIKTGVLTLQGYDTFANWNAALESVAFNYSGGSVDSQHPTRTITFEADDGAVLSNKATRTIMLSGPVANPPVVAGTTSAITWTEAIPAPVIQIASGLSITDLSATQLTSATVQITSNFSSSEDVLGWDNTLATADGITVTLSNGKSKLTLTGTADLASYQAVLQSVTYSDSSENPSTAPRTATFTVVDTNSITSAVTSNSQQIINVVAVNNPPLIATTEGATSYAAGHAAVLVDGASGPKRSRHSQPCRRLPSRLRADS